MSTLDDARRACRLLPPHVLVVEAEQEGSALVDYLNAHSAAPPTVALVKDSCAPRHDTMHDAALVELDHPVRRTLLVRAVEEVARSQRPQAPRASVGTLGRWMMQ